MKIIMYELLGMIKNGKAPKNIKMRGYIYEYQGDDYICKSHDCWLFSDGYTKFNEWLENFLNTEVEIIEENKIPEKINDKYCSQISKVELAQKYNAIIDYLESKED